MNIQNSDLKLSPHPKAFKKSLILSMLVIGLQLTGCESDERTNPIEQTPFVDLTKMPAPVEKPVDLPRAGTTFPFRFTLHKYVWAPFADADKTGLSVSPGWGYMAPMIVADGNDQYAILFFSCDGQKKEFYCVYLMKNGVQVSELHAMGLQLTPPNTIAKSTYQTPLLFKRGHELLLVYQINLSQGNSLINMISVDLTMPKPLKWTAKSAFVNTDGTLNYLGEAMARDGTIYVAGHGSGSGRGPRLELTRISPPYSAWDAKMTVVQFSGLTQIPVYPHVQVRNSDEIEVVAALHNGVPCDEAGESFSESYKAVVNYRGTYGHRFRETWRDSAEDVTDDDGGDTCLFHNQRFPLSQFYDSASDTIYTIVKTSEVPNVDPNNRVKSNKNFIRKFILYANGRVIVSDLSAKFSSYFASPNDIWSISGTRLSNGLFVFMAANDGLMPSRSDIAIVTSADLNSFTPVYRLPTTDSPEHSIHIAQPAKNGSAPIHQLHFMHSGTVYGRKNLHHRYHFYGAEPK